MAQIIDRRKSPQGKSIINRQRFLTRYKKQLKERIAGMLGDIKIRDTSQEKTINIKHDPTLEPHFKYKVMSGKTTMILQQNRHYTKGDKVRLLYQLLAGMSFDGEDSDEGILNDEFEFILSKEEFLHLLFEDMELPNQEKKTLFKTKTLEWKSKGYKKQGAINQLAIKKTFEMSFARRKATKKEDPFICEEDLRYRNKVRESEYTSKCVMFCVLDVSGSMDEYLKGLSKKFFILLDLFLQSKYDTVDIIFIRHHNKAVEVKEKVFFYGTETGGTEFLPAFQLVDAIIKKRYNPKEWNIYIAQSSDGDVLWARDAIDTNAFLKSKIFPIIQYMVYIQVGYPGDDLLQGSLYDYYQSFIDEKFFRSRVVRKDRHVYLALKKLFEKVST